MKRYLGMLSVWRSRVIKRRLVKAGAALVAAAALGSPAVSSAQGTPEYGKGVRINLNEDGSQYFRFITWHQIWTRFIQNNPGTLVDGDPTDNTFDVGLRRSRFLAYGQLAPGITLVMHMGVNNQTYNGERKPQIFMHGAWAQFDVVDKALTLGTGLHYVHGLSRMTAASTLNFLALDAPILNWPVIELTDQFARNLGIFAKGKAASLNYRLALNKPFAVAAAEAPDPSLAATFVSDPDALIFTGYADWEFLDPEGNLLPYTVGSYLGSKRVFNLGAGFHYHPGAVQTRAAGAAPEDHDVLLLSVDAFADIPLGGGSAVTAYGAFYYYDMGPNFVRNIGIMNLGTLPEETSGIETSLNGAGNAYPSVGTGNHVYLQAGYLLPGTFAGTRLQPYATVQFSDLEGRDDPAMIFEGGANWLVFGHHGKLTLNYRNRPIYTVENGESVVSERGSELILQTMIYY